MKYFANFLFSITVLCSCSSNEDKTELFIRDFFDSKASFTCQDSIAGKIYMEPLYCQFNEEIASFEYIIPDSASYSDFHNAYMNRLTNAFYSGKNADKDGVLDSLFHEANCDLEKVRNRITDYYLKDEVFVELFRTSLSSFYEKKQPSEEYPVSTVVEKIEIPLDSLAQLALLQFDLYYWPGRGFCYHFLCGGMMAPSHYSVDYIMDHQALEFCREALRNKEMYEAHSTIVKQVTEVNKEISEDEECSKEELCSIYLDEIRQMLLEEGTLTKSLLSYYEKRKDIEPFTISEH